MITSSFKTATANNFSLILVAALLAGVFCPGLDRLPDSGVIVVMVVIIFLACSNINQQDFTAVSVWEVVFFYVVRFIALPALFFSVANWTFPTYANGVLLMALVPAGVSSAALANLLRGSVSLALSITVLSTALTPIVIPLFFEFLANTAINIDTIGMFFTLSILVFTPVIADRILDKAFPQQRMVVRTNSGWLTVVLIGVLVLLVVGKYQQAFWQNPGLILICLCLLTLEFALFYLIGWHFAGVLGRGDLSKRISYATCSGANNCGLAAALAFLYLSPENGIFSVLSELPWVLALIPFKQFVSVRQLTVKRS